jgi:hypothetical protein
MGVWGSRERSVGMKARNNAESNEKGHAEFDSLQI